MADPIVEDMKCPTVPLELYVVIFQSHTIRVKLNLPYPSNPPSSWY
jgi:hypothetical protein